MLIIISIEFASKYCPLATMHFAVQCFYCWKQSENFCRNRFQVVDRILLNVFCLQKSISLENIIQSREQKKVASGGIQRIRWMIGLCWLDFWQINPLIWSVHYMMKWPRVVVCLTVRLNSLKSFSQTLLDIKILCIHCDPLRHKSFAYNAFIEKKMIIILRLWFGPLLTHCMLYCFVSGLYLNIYDLSHW